MEAIYWLIIILSVAVLLLITLLIIIRMYFLRQRTTIRIIMPNNKLFAKSFSKIFDTIEINKCIYKYDDTCAISNFWGKKIYYYEGNPNPINWNEGRKLKTNIPRILAKDLNILLKSRLIEQLFTTESLEKLILILIVVGIIISLGMGFFNHSTVQCLTANQTREVVVSAIKGM